MKLSENAKRIKNNEYISKQIAETQFNKKYARIRTTIREDYEVWSGSVVRCGTPIGDY